MTWTAFKGPYRNEKGRAANSGALMQAPGPCQDERKNEKYKIGSKGKAVDEENDGSSTMALILDHLSLFYMNIDCNL